MATPRDPFDTWHKWAISLCLKRLTTPWFQDKVQTLERPPPRECSVLLFLPPLDSCCRIVPRSAVLVCMGGKPWIFSASASGFAAG